MKRINTFIAIVLVALSSSSCVKDFLDIKPRGKEIASTYDHYLGMLNHTTLVSFSGNYVYQNLGEETIGNNSTMTQLQTKQGEPGVLAFQYDANPYMGDVNAPEWDAPYAHIYRYNVIIAEVMDAEGGTEEQKKQILAEARVQRAYMHFLASLMFSKPYNESTASTDISVPIVTRANTMDSENYKLSTVKEIYDWMIKEISESIPDLQIGEKGVTRVYKGVANALLGRIYMQKGDYASALTCLRDAKTQIAEIKDYALLDYRAKGSSWLGGKTYYKSYPRFYTSSECVCTHYLTIFTNLTSDTAVPIFGFKPEFVSQYTEGDLRAMLITKHAASGVDRPIGRQEQNFMLELPDLYMMLAECEARKGDAGKARDLMLEYRKTRFTSDELAAIPASVDSNDKLIQFIVKERVLEYPGLGVSVIDMKRLWNDPLFADKKAAYVHTGADSKTFSADAADQLTWKIPFKVKRYHTDWAE